MAVKFQKGGSKPEESQANQSNLNTGGAGKTPSFMKKGKAAQDALQQEQKKAEEKAAQMGKLFRYWMPVDAENAVTFLDGKLDDDGILDAPMFLEHQLFMNGSWKNWFVCVSEEEPCPICEGGAESRLVAAFTVIDHSEYTNKNGQLVKDTKKLFVCKRDTYKLLQKIATKRGGLAGCRFDVSRTGKNEPSVGNVFDFTEKMGKKAILAACPTLKEEDLAPANYEEEFPWLSATELRDMGFGGQVVGSEKPPQEHVGGGGSAEDLEDQL